MKTILFHLNCLERGGAERVVTTLSGQFVKNGYQVMIATEWQGEEEYEIDSRITRVHVGLDKKQERHGRIGRYLDRIRNLRSLVQKTKPDIVIAFARLANYRALMATVGIKTPVMISVRIHPIGYYDFLPDKILIPTILRRASGCVFQTPAQRDFFPEFLQKKSKIILNPINEKFIGNPIPDEKDREKAVVHSGRLVDFKNQLLLIRAFLRVHEKHPDYVLKLYGPDSFDGTKEKLEALIEETDSEHFVFLMGSSSQLEKDLINGAVAAFSSDYEGMPNAMLEAMALGLPVVATDCPPGGPRMVIENEKNGLLVPTRDENALAEAINRLIEDRAFAGRLGAEAAKIGEIASSERIFAEWETYVNQLIDQS
ncbi:MAG: glycosyltransferase family 4 protein [Lachnospiraceae bacterium]|nr:glycosyltransferase family 4 protein [Lachnospiraceae bacterium]